MNKTITDKSDSMEIPELNGILKLHLNDQVYNVRILGMSDAGMNIILEDEIDTLIIEGMLLNNVEIFIDDVFQGYLNLGISTKSKMVIKGDEILVALAEALDKKASYKLWEIAYYQKSVPSRKRQNLDVNNLPKIPGRGQYTEDARQERLVFIRQNTRASLLLVEETTLNPQKLTNNIEAFIGTVEIPVGIAGPLWINGKKANGFFYAPMATSEGALVASVTRGALAITKSGGATTYVMGQRMLRVPLFIFDDIHSALFFAGWLRDHLDGIKEETKKYSMHAELTELDPQVIGRSVHVHFVYETGDASGQNMTTSCTWHACLWILEQMKYFDQIKFNNFFIDGGMSSDKKVSYQSFIKGRGIRVVAEVFIPGDILLSVLKVTPHQIAAAYHAGISGVIHSGIIGMNINIANVIAAIFTATGQDIACVHESSIAHFSIEAVNNGLYARMHLPSLIVGTVGGGTSLPQQRECLEILNCEGQGNAHKLAEIIAAYCLALDLSTLAALASGQFASAHERLGRNRPVKFITRDDLNKTFFEDILKKSLHDDKIEVIKLEHVDYTNTGSSIVTELSAQNWADKLMGHYPYMLQYTAGNYLSPEIEVMVKVKPTDAEIIHVSSSVAMMCDARLGSEFKKTKGKTGFVDCHIRELAIFEQNDPIFMKYLPKCYGIYRNDDRQGYIIVQELLKDMVLMDTADDMSGWTDKHIFTAIDGLSDIHSVWYGRESELKEKEWIGSYPTSSMMVEFSTLWRMAAGHAFNEFPDLFSKGDLDGFNAKVSSVSDWWGGIERMKKTLIHNDFSPRNIAFRNTEDGLRLCVYDWELATIHLPQHDLAELLAFVLDGNTTKEELVKFVEYHRKGLERTTGQAIDRDEWWEGFRYSCWDLLLNRFALLFMAHTVRHYEFLDHVRRSFRKILEIVH